MNNTLGNKIKQLRKQKNISQEVLARRQLLQARQVLKVLQEDPEAQCLTEMEIAWRQEMLVKIEEKIAMEIFYLNSARKSEKTRHNE